MPQPNYNYLESNKTHNVSINQSILPRHHRKKTIHHSKMLHQMGQPRIYYPA